jgi:hypothetical protein
VRGVARLVALLLGLALAAAAVVAAIESVLLVAGQPSLVVPRTAWAHDLSRLGWDDTLLDVVAAGLVAVGVVILLVGLVPRRPSRILVGLPAPGTTWVSRKGLCRRVAHDVGDLPEVDDAAVRIRGHRVLVRARLAPGVTAGDGRALAERAAAPLLGRLAPEVPLRVSVRVRTTAEPVATTTAPVGAGQA